MAEFPRSPIAPAEFFESFVPAHFATLDLPDPIRRVALRIGVHLHGEGGGEWLYQLRDGDLEVAAGGCAEASFKLIQSVDDWRGTLWEGRGAVVAGVLAERGLRLLRTGRLAAFASGAADASDVDLIARLVDLGGVLRAVVSDGRTGDWAIAFQFGPGEVPAEPTTTVRVGSDDVNAMAKGDLAPLQAFLAGRVSIAGDMLLLMQLQALISELRDRRQGP